MCQVVSKAWWVSVYVCTLRIKVHLLFELLVSPPPFLPRLHFLPSTPYLLLGRIVVSLLLPGLRLHLRTLSWVHRPESRDKVRNLLLETWAGKGGGKSPSTEGKQPHVSLPAAAGLRCPSSNCGAGRAPCCPALPSQTGKLRPQKRRDLPKVTDWAGSRPSGWSIVQLPTAPLPVNESRQLSCWT